jgi:hypothetical protein
MSQSENRRGAWERSKPRLSRAGEASAIKRGSFFRWRPKKARDMRLVSGVESEASKTETGRGVEGRACSRMLCVVSC